MAWNAVYQWLLGNRLTRRMLDTVFRNRARRRLAEVEVGVPYAVALSSPAGYWACRIGLTVRFEGRDPPLLQLIDANTAVSPRASGERGTEDLLGSLCRRAPWVLAGFDQQLASMWKSDRGGVIAAVDERRRRILSDDEGDVQDVQPSEDNRRPENPFQFGNN